VVWLISLSLSLLLVVLLSYRVHSTSFFCFHINNNAMQILKASFHLHEKLKWFHNHPPSWTAFNWAKIRIYMTSKISLTERYNSKLLLRGLEKLVLSTWQAPLLTPSWDNIHTNWGTLFPLPAVLTEASQPLVYLKLRLSTEAISHVVLERDKRRLDIEHATFFWCFYCLQ
jgi:hypothetical protein